MPQSGERSQPRRRSRYIEGQGPDPLTYPAPNGRTGSSPNTDSYEDEGIDEPRHSTSVIRLDNPTTMQSARITGSSTQGIPVTPRRQTQSRDFPRQQRPLPPQPAYEQVKSSKNVHWLLPLGIGMVAMLVLWVLGSSILAWGLQQYNNFHYGNPRTYQTNAVVGQGDSPSHPSHFIALNLNHQAVVIELIAGDPSKSITYVAPVYIAEDNANPSPVTVEFRDVNGDKKPDMIIHIHLPNQDQVSVFINDGTKFRPSNSTDKIHV